MDEYMGLKFKGEVFIVDINMKIISLWVIFKSINWIVLLIKWKNIEIRRGLDVELMFRCWRVEEESFKEIEKEYFMRKEGKLEGWVYNR